MPRERFGLIFIPSKRISAYTRMTTSYMPGTRHKRVDIAGTGFTVLDRIYADGHFTEEALGGSCGNVFLSLAMLHWRVAPVLALGMDETGGKLVGAFIDAGAETRFISRRPDLRSPVLTQVLDTSSGRHWYRSKCPDTDVNLPRYHPIGEDDVLSAKSALEACTVFYTDRLSISILMAMKIANSSGAIVIFEPSAIEHKELFDSALPMVHVLKYSAERLGYQRRAYSPFDTLLTIVTHGTEGLDISVGRSNVRYPAISASKTVDESGSGDMVSIGLIDTLLKNRSRKRKSLTLRETIRGVVAGQHLAAANCSFHGARGVFQNRSVNYVRNLISQVDQAFLKDSKTSHP